MRRFAKFVAFAAVVFGLSATGAGAVTLKIVNVGAPAVNCVFNVTCTIIVNDSVGNFTPPGDSGSGFLQSRTYVGTAPAPAAGLGGYDYRVALTNVKALTADNCVTRLDLNFGPDVKMPYTPSVNSDVFVVTSGGLGSVGLTSATLSLGTKIAFIFSSPVCPGQTSYFFGLASKSAMPKPGSATLYFSLGGSVTVPDRTP